jgi:hypothetical protein
MHGFTADSGHVLLVRQTRPSPLASDTPAGTTTSTATSAVQMASPSPTPLRSEPRCSNGRNSSSVFPGGRPPHSSSTSKSTRSNGCTHSQRDVATLASELESVLQQIGNRRRENLAIAFDGHGAVDGRNRKVETAGLRLQRRADLDFSDEVRHGNVFETSYPRVETHVGE